MRRVTYTHKAWFGICPIYITNFMSEQDIPDIDYRHWIFMPLMWVSEVMMDFYNFMRSSLDDDYKPAYLIYVTGKLDQPITREYN